MGGGGGHMKFYPYARGGGAVGKGFAILKGKQKTFWGSFYTVA